MGFETWTEASGLHQPCLPFPILKQTLCNVNKAFQAFPTSHRDLQTSARTTAKLPDPSRVIKQGIRTSNSHTELSWILKWASKVSPTSLSHQKSQKEASELPLTLQNFPESPPEASDPLTAEVYSFLNSGIQTSMLSIIETQTLTCNFLPGLMSFPKSQTEGSEPPPALLSDLDCWTKNSKHESQIWVFNLQSVLQSHLESWPWGLWTSTSLTKPSRLSTRCPGPSTSFLEHFWCSSMDLQIPPDLQSHLESWKKPSDPLQALQTHPHFQTLLYKPL